jgi:teichuronic acid biosynthesis glycosyltransferase TuaC
MPSPKIDNTLVVPAVRAERPLKVLYLSRNYPNNVLPLLGLWVQGLVENCARLCECRVISPVPYCPPLPAICRDYTRFRTVVRQQHADGIEVFHPRFLVPPSHRFHGVESYTYYVAILKLVRQLHQRFPFELIHAHYTYPDGWVAARLGRALRLPVVITEQNPWKPWMDDYPAVRRQATWAARQCDFHIAISEVVRKEITYFVDQPSKLRVIPDGIDASVFTLPRGPRRSQRKHILFVGIIRPVKGMDILLRALRLLTDRGHDEKLLLIGESFYPAYRKEYERLQRMAIDLGLGERVEFMGAKPLDELVRQMQQSKVLVLPSRKESLGMVLVEALACGTPVVATRCGGPEDIVNDRVGVLVRPEDPEALAQGIEHVLEHGNDYDPVLLREYAVENFSWNRIALQYVELYREAIERHATHQRQGIAAR